VWLAAFAAAAMMSCAREAPEETPRQTFEQNPRLLPQGLRNGALAAASPEELRSAIDRWGADAVVASLWGREADAGWNRFLDHVAAGEEDWLRLTPLIKPATDGGASMTLRIALSDALQHNAPEVLRLIASGSGDTSICAMIALEPTDEEVAQFYASTIRAVEAVAQSDLQAIKTECLDSLRRDAATL
jgi:hypothetical protein